MKTRFAAVLAAGFAFSLLAPLSVESTFADTPSSATVAPGPDLGGYPNYRNRYPRFINTSRKSSYGVSSRYPQYYTSKSGSESLYRPYRVSSGYRYSRYYYKSHVGKYGLPYIHVRYQPEDVPHPYYHHYHHDERRFR
jgi:hypothetical protein